MKETVAIGFITLMGITCMLAIAAIIVKDSYLMQDGIISYVTMKNETYRKPW